MNMEDFAVECNATARDKGWWRDESDHVLERKLLLIITEITETYEAYRLGEDLDEILYREAPDGSLKPEGIAVELADTIIRVFDLCVEKNIPIIRALREKADYNKKRPFRHGGKRA